MQIFNRFSVPAIRASQLLNHNSTMYKAVYNFSVGYESLVSQISQCQSPIAVLDQYLNHRELFKSEHLVMSLRMLGRFSKIFNNEIQDKEEYQNAFAELIKQLEQQISDMSDFELIDILFWIRKAKQSKVQLNLSTLAYVTLFKRLNEAVNQKVYSFRNLINIYYDLSMLGKQTEFLVEQIQKSIKNDPNQITPFIGIQLSQALAKRSQQMSFREWILADNLIKQLPQIVTELDLDQKSQLFGYLSELELNYHIPSFKIPNIMYKIRVDLLNKLETISEFAVLNILDAYNYLPPFYPVDLYEEVKEMIVVTLEHNPTNLKTYFLLEVIEKISKYPKRKADDKKFEKIAKEISKRFSDELPTFLNLERLAKALVRLKSPQELIEVISGITLQYLKKENPEKKRAYSVPYSTLDYLMIVKADVSQHLEELSKIPVDQLQISQRLKALALFDKHQEQFTQYFQDLKQALEKDAETNLEQIIMAYEMISYRVSAVREIVVKAAQNLKEAINEQNINRYVKFVYISCVNRESRQLWQDYFTKDKLNKGLINKFIEEFHLQSYLYETENIKLFLYIISQRPQDLNLSKVTNLFQQNFKLTIEMAKNDQHLRKLVYAIIAAKEAKPKDIRLIDIVSIVLRLDQFGYQQDIFRFLLKRCYELNKQFYQSEVIPASSYTDGAYISQMIKYNVLDENEALSLADNIMKYHDLYFKSKVLALAQQAEGSERVNEYVNILVNELAEKLKSEKASIQLISIAPLIGFHPSVVQPYQTQILQILKENSSKVNEKLFNQLIRGFQPKWILQRETRNIILPILREVINMYPQGSKRSGFNEILLAMEQICVLKVKNTSLMNHFLEDFGKQFEQISPEQRVRTLQIFGNMSIKQNDFFQKNLEKINSKPEQFRHFVGDIAESLFKVGMDDPQIFGLFKNLVDGIHQEIGLYDSIKILSLYTINDVDINIMKGYTDQFINKDRSFEHKRFNICLLHEYFKRKYGDDKAEPFAKLLKPESLKETYEKIFEKRKNRDFLHEITQYLDTMNVEYHIGVKVDDLSIDVHIPSQKIILLINRTFDYNFDNQSVNGQSLMLKKIYETIPDHKIISLALKELIYTGTTPMDKVNFLIGKGIQSNVTSGKYDFTNIKTTAVKKPIVEEVEEEEQ